MVWLRGVYALVFRSVGCLFEAVGFAVDCDDLGVVDKAIDQGGDAGRGGKDLAPFGEWAIGRDQSALVLIAARDELEQQIGMTVRVGEVSDLVDDQECRVDVVAQPASQR
jgi:hypothetical protein